MAAARKLLVIIGPTASGKSALAMELARRTGAQLLSADSMQVYRGMDIGTAKPSAAERAEVPHHGLDLVTPAELYTVANFVAMADAAIARCAAAGVPLIVTGGTPLYFKALFEGLFDGPGADDALRARLAGESNEALHARLSAVDPAAAARIHVRDTRRLIRALEVFELTGKPISSMQNEWREAGEGEEGRREGGEEGSGGAGERGRQGEGKTARQNAGVTGGMRHSAVWVGVDWERETLNRRINARVKGMMAAGWLAETRGLVEQYGELSKTASGATGYRELIEHLAGRVPLEEAVEQIKIATRQLARKQMKWFRRFRGVVWMNGEKRAENVAEVMERWSGGAAELPGSA